MSVSTRRPKILAGGSLDVDNFGDLLFLLLTERYLSGADIIPAGPFGWNMFPVLGRSVQPYAPALANEKFDAIWIMGGEFGGKATLEEAFNISAPDNLYGAYQQASPEERKRILELCIGNTELPPIVHAFMPPSGAYSLNARTPTIINSVGISEFLREPTRRQARLEYLRKLTLASVRDRESSDLLTKYEIEHTLAPDAIHALPLIHPVDTSTRSDVALFQIAKPVLLHLGIKNVAQALANCKQLHRLPIRILMTGTWREGADSVSHNEELCSRIKGLVPTADVGLIIDRRPWDLVNHIRTARIAIGTSLHLRIVAAAYHVPRVTLAMHISGKPTRYARLWDPHMPYDVSLDKLHGAIETALDKANRGYVISNAEDATNLANKNLRKMSASVMERIAPKHGIES